MRTLTRSLLANDGAGRCVVLLLVLASFVMPRTALAQETEPPDGTRISSATVSGLDVSRLSPGLRDEIGRLAGTSLNRAALRELAARLEGEQPRYVAAVRVAADADGGARITFVAARMRDPEYQANINSKYTVEEAEITGVPEDRISAELRSELQALTGKPLDADQAERIEVLLKSAFNDYDVDRRTVRGGEPGNIKLVYHLERSESSRWLRYDPLEANAVYHSDQGWGAKMPLTMSGADFRVVPFFALDVADELVEEYSGLGIRVESRRIGTDRLGASFQWATFNQDWRDQTLAAVGATPGIPAPYRNRMSVTPLVHFAITRQLTVGGGVSIAELDDLNEASSDAQMANAAIGLVAFSQRWKRSSGREHDLDAAFSFRSGSEALQSDLDYDRYFAAQYRYHSANHRVFLSGLLGRINGAAPLFERFSLGDSRTLRGWDKYAITPAGGDQLFYASLEYRHRLLALFVDAGSAWDTGTERRMRFSSGFGLTPGPVFLTLGFPLNTDEFRAVFTAGIRFTTFALGDPRF